MSIKSFISKLFKLHRHKINKQWRERNISNFTDIDLGSSGIDNVIIGNGTYGTIKVFNDSDDLYLRIGNYCSIAKDVIFIVCRDHETRRLTTYPIKQMYKMESDDYRDAIGKNDIVIDDDVWIGYGATILSGVHVSQGAIIASGAVVTHDVPPYAICGGVPAKVIKYRFSQPVIDYLLTLDYTKLNEEMLKSHVNELYAIIDGMNLNDVKKLFEWFPKKQ